VWRIHATARDGRKNLRAVIAGFSFLDLASGGIEARFRGEEQNAALGT